MASCLLLWRRRLGPLLAVGLILCGAVTQFASRTPDGVQCPTAPVQRIVEVIHVADPGCCVHNELVARVPKPGDKAFLQCRCAEKKAAGTTALSSSEFAWVIFFEPSSKINSFVQRWPHAVVLPGDGEGVLNASLPPPVPPPDC